MKLHEIISANEKTGTSIICKELLKYKKQLYIYYKNEFCCEPVLMVTDVFNAAQYAKIVPSNEFTEYLNDYVETLHLNKEDKTAEVETINFNSRMLSDLFNN